ncbi:MAG: PAS domain S-box protein [Gammaproteobacteria bacterium]|nr:PAS domain S-box protein [Gammaproteobacteria bacterium]
MNDLHLMSGVVHGPHETARRFRSLQHKLLLPLLLLSVVVAVIVLWSIYWAARYELADKLRQRAAFVADTLNSAAENISRRGELQQIVAAVGSEQDILDVVIVAGVPPRVIAATKTIWLDKWLSELPGEEVAGDLEKAIRLRASHSHFNVEQQLFDYSSPLRISHAESAAGVHVDGAVMVHFDTRSMQAAITSSALLYSSTFLAVLLTFAALVYGLLNHYVLRPIMGIKARVENRRETAHQSWVETSSNDEIGALAKSLHDALVHADEVKNALEQQKQAVLESETRYRLIATYSSDIISRFSVDGILSYVSPASASVLGYAPEQMLGKSWFEWIHPEDIAVTKDKLKAVLSSYMLDTLTCRLRNVEGGYIWMETSLRALRETTTGNSMQNAAQIVGVSRDITERQASEGALRDQAEQTQAIINNMVDGVITIDQAGIMTSFNPAAERIFGYAPEEVLGRNIKMLMPNPDYDAHDSYLQNFKTTRVARIIGIGREVIGQRKNSSQFPMDLAVSEVTREGRPIYVGMVRDVSERKRVERMKNEFVSAVSHELRTPMNAILGFTQLLSYDANMTDKQKANLGKVHKAGDHLLSIINDVLDLSRIEAGKVSLSMEPVAISAVLRECRNLIQQQADARRIHLQLDIDNADVYWVQADRTRLRQVLLNFMSNAVKYNREGGSVWVACTPAAGGRVRISVRDTGFGVAPDKQAEMFQPFNRLGAERSEIEGTGIGLTITKQLVEMMQGEIGLTSTPGEGSTFWVEFSRASGALDKAAGETEAALANVLTARIGQHRILYIEDNVVNLEFVQALCTQFWPKMQLLTAVNAEDGLLTAAAQLPEVILMDINLPGIDGYEALKQLKADTALRHIPVVAVTANAMKENIARGRSAGFAGYLTKPIDIPRFLAVLDGLLSQSARQVTPPADGVRVLLAEDNVVNQEVARGLLEVLGYSVDVVNDGRAAVEAVTQTSYAAVLMDCEMPVLDGYAATAAIRALESTMRHTPVIAVTAHAPGEDAMQRRAAGMDDYLAKPINIEQLRVVLTRWVKSGNLQPPALISKAATLDARATQQLKSLLGARTVPIVDSLLGDLPRRLEELRDAIDRGDVQAARNVTHTMCGSSSNLGATAFAALCTQANSLCKTGELARLPDLYAQLTQEFHERVAPALTCFKHELLQDENTSKQP